MLINLHNVGMQGEVCRIYRILFSTLTKFFDQMKRSLGLFVFKTYTFLSNVGNPFYWFWKIFLLFKIYYILKLKVEFLVNAEFLITEMNSKPFSVNLKSMTIILIFLQKNFQNGLK